MATCRQAGPNFGNRGGGWGSLICEEMEGSIQFFFWSQWSDRRLEQIGVQLRNPEFRFGQNSAASVSEASPKFITLNGVFKREIARFEALNCFAKRIKGTFKTSVLKRIGPTPKTFSVIVNDQANPDSFLALTISK